MEATKEGGIFFYIKHPSKLSYERQEMKTQTLKWRGQETGKGSRFIQKQGQCNQCQTPGVKFEE